MTSESIEIRLPDIGDYKNVPVIEILAKVGDRVAVDDLLLMIESDKAAMEVPSPAAGVVTEILVSIGTRVSEGIPLMRLAASSAAPVAEMPQAAPPAVVPAPTQPAVSPQPAASVPAPVADAVVAQGAYASPSVRALARELGVPLSEVRPTGPKGRILREDVAAFVKGAVTPGDAPARPAAAGTLPDWPKIDFAKFGPVERRPLSRIQKLSGGNLARNWQVIPHVTNFDRADVSDLEQFRQTVNRERGETEAKITMVAFLLKASALALKAYPAFNASLDGQDLILKAYVHVGFAADTPQGLMVPVVRDCDAKGILQIADEVRMLAGKARAGGLAASDMQGGCFTVSSLGGVGGQGFTPIINAPEVAILGAGRAATEPVWDGAAFQPRLILPVSLSWDHRVVDGVAAARFLGHVATLLGDLRRIAL